MALKAILDTLDGLSEELKKEYKAGEGKLASKFILDVTATEGFELDNVTSLKATLQKERNNVETLKTKVKAFEGIDPEAAKEALAKVDEISKFNPDQKIAEGIRVREETLTKKHKADLDAKVTEATTLQKQLEEVLIDNAAIKALTDAKGSVKLLLPHVKSSTRLRKTADGKFISEVLDADGNPRISPKAGSQDGMTISELIEEMKGSDDYSSAFAASGATGSGAGGGAGATGKTPAVNGHKGVKTISANDHDALSANIDGIADGSVVVTGI